MRLQAPQVTPGRQDDAAMLATASSRLGRGKTGANRAQGSEPQSGQNVTDGRPPKLPQFGENDPTTEFLWLPSHIPRVAYRERQGFAAEEQGKSKTGQITCYKNQTA
jgi:hypothetical protein